MKLLLDTHTAAWFVQASGRLSEPARLAIIDRRSEVLLSAVVVWEIAIKRGLGKLPVSGRYIEALLDGGAQPLSITLEHARAVETLPAHHRDPFDRLLIAQAAAEQATIVTHDPQISRYGVPTLW